jgi:formylglycine-generating enzyme required for sulfatase activity
MRDWQSGSIKVICSNDISVNALIQKLKQNSDISLPRDYLEVGKNYDSNSLSKLNTGPLKFTTNIFLIQKNEVTISEYIDFLNAIAKIDVNGLYSPSMVNIGIKKTAGSGDSTYSVDSAFENYPVTYVSWQDAARYANWIANGKPTGPQSSSTTEDGVYNIKSEAVTRNAINPNTGKPPTYWLLNESEWYTSAYLKSDASGIWNYPTQSDSAPDASGGNLSNFANFGGVFGETTPVGFFDQSPGPFGTFDQGGNVREWTETLDTSSDSPMRIIRGGSWADPADSMRADESHVADPNLEDDKTGFRIGGAP